MEDKISDVVEENPGAVNDFKDGKDSAMNFFIGQIMSKTNGKADAAKARKILNQEISWHSKKNKILGIHNFGFCL